MEDKFVNPYTFVPFPDVEVVRSIPSGHDPNAEEAGQLFAGTLNVKWRLASPLLLPATAQDEGWIAKSGASFEIRIPGSSVKGSIRSQHETLFNGCLRVFDGDFVPSYRDPRPEPGQDRPRAKGDWRLGLVLEAVDGLASKIQITDGDDFVALGAVLLRNDYIKAATSPNAIGKPATKSLPTTGDLLEFFDRETPPHLFIPAKSSVTFENVAGKYVFVVTDTRARNQQNETSWTAGRLSEEVLTVESVVGLDFRAACVSSDDHRELSKETDVSWKSKSHYTEVKATRGAGVVARRLRTTGYLHPGNVVWARLEGGKIARIKASQIWRHTGSGATRSRIPGWREETPSWLEACTDSQSLCPSCAIFGAADASGSDGGAAQQHSYAGHVRFDSAIAQVSSVDEVELAPLGSPNPGSGQFYLSNQGSTPPERDWTETDERKLAGRKFYWHGNPDLQGLSVPRYRRRPDQSEQLSRVAQLVPTGTLFEERITFDGLKFDQLQQLLMTINPNFDSRLGFAATHLGGGKPFGLGSVACESMTGEVTTVAGRYAGGQPESVERFVEGATFARPQLTALRPLVLEALKGDAAYLSYPPGDSWDQFGLRSFDESFRFFMRDPKVALPRITAADQKLPRTPLE